MKRVVRRNFAVVDNRVVEQRERMRAAPPAGGVRRITAVRRPAVALILVEPVKPSHILGIADGLEYAHVLAAGENVCAFELCVDVHDGPGDELLLVELETAEHRRQRGYKVTPDERHVGDLGNNVDGNLLGLHKLEALSELRFALAAHRVVVKEDVERVTIAVFRVDAVGGKAAAETVGTVVHRYHALHDRLAGHAPPLPGDDGGNSASGGDADLALALHENRLLSGKYERSSFHKGADHPRKMNSFAH